MMTDRVEIALEIPAHLHEPVVYEGLVLADAARERAAEAFLEWLAAGSGREVLHRHGFQPAP